MQFPRLDRSFAGLISLFQAEMEDATKEFSGCMIRADCGLTGIFEGKVIGVDPLSQIITIEEPTKLV
jgi:hypothetical protein